MVANKLATWSETSAESISGLQAIAICGQIPDFTSSSLSFSDGGFLILNSVASEDSSCAIEKKSRARWSRRGKIFD